MHGVNRRAGSERTGRGRDRQAVTPHPRDAAESFVIVSGLPRSGTSLMMQMLAAGGLPPLTDGIRPADPDNPRGYFEWEPIKRIRDHPEALCAARGRALKVVSALLEELPSTHRYSVIFMERDVAEVQASQREMLRRRSRTPKPDDVSEDDLARHLERVRAWIERQPNFRCCFVSHAEVLARPAETAARVRDFLGLPLDPQRMAAAVDPALYHQRRSSPTS